MLGANEDDALFFDTPGKVFVLRQKAVARMHRLGASGLASGNDFVSHQVRLARRGRPEQHGLIGQPHMAGFLVGLGINSDGGNAHLAGGGDHAAGDFAAVGNQDFLEHRISPAFHSDRIGLGEPSGGVHGLWVGQMDCLGASASQ